MSQLAETIFTQLENAGLPRFEREYQFAPTVDGVPIRNWRFDGALPEHLLAIEIDGGTFRGGRHTRGVGHWQDAVKRNVAQLMGWRVLVLTDRDRWKSRAVRLVATALGRADALAAICDDA